MEEGKVKFKVNDWLMIQSNVESEWQFVQVVGLNPLRIFYHNEVHDDVRSENLMPIPIADVLERFATLWDKETWIVDECFNLKASAIGGYRVYSSCLNLNVFKSALIPGVRIQYLHELQECYRKFTKSEADFEWFLGEPLIV